MPDPIAKVDEGGMLDDDDLSLSFISDIGGGNKGGDPGDIFGENAPPKELTMAEQLAAAASKLKSVSAVSQEPKKELTMAEQLAAAASKLKSVSAVSQEPKKELTMAE